MQRRRTVFAAGLAVHVYAAQLLDSVRSNTLGDF